MIIETSDYEAILQAAHTQPHAILGLHPATQRKQKGLVARAFLRDAVTCEVVDLTSQPERRYPLKRIADEGLFEGFIKDHTESFRYRLRIEKHNGEIRQFYDPYSFLPTLGEQDLYLFNEGNEHFIYNKLGSQLREINGVRGVSFAVWAPSAQRISVVGDFNHWDGRYHPMRTLGSSGVWEIFIPGLEAGAKYKYEIKGADGLLHLKTDPYGSFFEAPPHNASIIWPVNDYNWQDAGWIAARASTNWKSAPISVYECHFGSWKRKPEDGNRPLTYREMADELPAYLLDLGYTHVEFLPLAEHPFDGSWGYQVTGYFAATQRFGTPQDFMYLVDTLHRHNLGVIMDWVPGHFPRDAFALAHFDGSHLYEHADPRQGAHMDWGTLIFNYGRHEIRCFLVASALAWFDRYHIDGLRVDAVASMLYLDYSRKSGEWIPNKFGGNENLEAIDFLRCTNDLVHKYYPGALMIAEESTAWSGVSKPTSEGGLGFDFKWNMGWMNDSLVYFQKDPIYRKWHHNNLTFGMIYQYSENFINVFSHDEVVHGKGSMLMKMSAPDITGKANNLRALYAFTWAWPGKNTLFMGSDFGQSLEWKYDGSLEWHLLQYADHEGVRRVIRDLNALYKTEPALHETDNDPAGFEWLSIDDKDSCVVAFWRKNKAGTNHLLVIGHYTPVVRHGYRLGVPFNGFWKEVLNTDSRYYGGSDAGNAGGLRSEDHPWNRHSYSVCLTLAPNSTTIFKYEG
ncbi:MAG: 1,4-alpha-glucan branching protein GlgB [Verrucomicrobiota bacterium]|nr:1,4-alpha-glucan branching protein GlgB [Verrucomicrobiota bacterium]